jgi:hypothetical protein
MTNGTAPTSYREQAEPLSKMYWLDIKVNFKEIKRKQRMISSDHLSRLPSSSLHYSILNGIGTVENALSVGNGETTFNYFEVDVAAFVQTHETFGQSELNRAAKMIWSEVDVQSPRLEIYVQHKMLRHLVELYVTKRIDTTIMSMKIAVTRQPMADADPGSELLPLLDADQRLYFRRTQCELLSVHASLGGERRPRQR